MANENVAENGTYVRASHIKRIANENVVGNGTDVRASHKRIVNENVAGIGMPGKTDR